MCAVPMCVCVCVCVCAYINAGFIANAFAEVYSSLDDIINNYMYTSFLSCMDLMSFVQTQSTY